MGRWRPPAPKSSPYITVQGFAALQEDLEDHWRRRRVVVKALAAAAAEGDRSENAEYIYRKKELAGIDRRIHYLQKRLPELNVVRDTPTGDAIYFGASVSVQVGDSDIQNYRIVGPDETDAGKNAISLDSPMARALLKKRVGDEVSIAVGDSTCVATVLDIQYRKSD